MSVTREQVQPCISEQYGDNQLRELVERHVDSEYFETGIARAKVRGTGTSVAAVIMILEAEDGNLERAAWQYHLTFEQVLGVVFFYWEHQDVIYAEITVRTSAFLN